MDPEELRAALARLTSEPVEVRETHISWVFLAGERAYKCKKPLVLPFLDYGSAESRLQMCIEEVRLNRRLAPDIYLGVRAIVGTDDGLDLGDADDPDAIDYVVEMRRYDEQRTLAAALDRGELRRDDVLQVARTLAEFHARSEPVRGRERGARGIERQVDRNIEELLGVAALRGERAQIRTLARFMTAFLAARRRLLDARAARGRTRECHGDLRAEHVVLGPPVRVVDCVEFDPELRTLDVADDLAFLIMDLTVLGGERFAAQLLEGYRAAGGDPGDDPLVAFFAVHRALVRAKVLLVRADQHPAGSAAHGYASARARELLAVADRFAWRARLPLVLVLCGVPASGKSHLAAALAARSGLPRLSSDLVRKRLAGIRPTETASHEHYSAEFSRATYAELGRLAAGEVAQVGGALVDATFRHRADRDAFAEAFGGAAPLQYARCTAPAPVLAKRAVGRERDPARVSDASVDVVLRERWTWEPLDEVAPERDLALRTDRHTTRILADLLALLDERLS